MTRNRLLRRGLTLGVLALLTIGAIAAWRMTRLDPTWYRPPDPTDQRVIDLADRAEYRLVEEAQRIRPPEDSSWTIRVEDALVNAWLSARLPQWVQHDAELQWPAALGTPQVHTDTDGIRLALPVENEDSRVVVTARLIPDVRDGLLHVRLDRLWIGRIGLPGEPMTRLAEFLQEHGGDALSEPQIGELLDVLAGRTPLDPVFALADERRVELTAIRLGKGLVDVTCRTRPPAADG